MAPDDATLYRLGSAVPRRLDKAGKLQPIRHLPPEILAQRRERVVALRAEGLTFVRIAARLGISASQAQSDAKCVAKAAAGYEPRYVMGRADARRGLLSVAVSLHGLREGLRGQMLGDWRLLYTDPEAEAAWDAIEATMYGVFNTLRGRLAARADVRRKKEERG